MVPALMISMIGASLFVGWWIGARSQPVAVDEAPPAPPVQAPTDPGSTGTSPQATDPGAVSLSKQLDAARIASANARHALDEALAEGVRLQGELERARALAQDREAKLRLAERMLQTANDARRAAADAQVEAEEELAQLRLQLVTQDARAHHEAATWRERAEAREAEAQAAQARAAELTDALTRAQAELTAARAALAEVPAVPEPDEVRAALEERVQELLTSSDALREALAIAASEYDVLRKTAQTEIDLLRGDLAAATEELTELRERVFNPTRRRVS